MSVVTIEAKRYTCDNPSCGVTRLSENGVPPGWFLAHALVSIGNYCSKECIRQHLRVGSIEQRDTGGGWIVSSLPRIASKPKAPSRSEGPQEEKV